MQQRKYEVIGTDDLNDVHIYRTDDRARAEEVAEAMREDLDTVELLQSDAPPAAQEPRVPRLDEQNFALDPSLDSGL